MQIVCKIVKGDLCNLITIYSDLMIFCISIKTLFLFVDIFLKYMFSCYLGYFTCCIIYFVIIGLCTIEPGVLTPAHIKVYLPLSVLFIYFFTYLEGKNQEKVKMGQSWKERREWAVQLVLSDNWPCPVERRMPLCESQDYHSVALWPLEFSLNLFSLTVRQVPLQPEFICIQ